MHVAYGRVRCKTMNLFRIATHAMKTGGSEEASARQAAESRAQHAEAELEKLRAALEQLEATE